MELYFVHGSHTVGNRVGSKGQVVISKATRDRLGIRAGWEALERVVNDCVEIRFLPPPHDRSLKGSLAQAVRRRPRGSLTGARRDAWARAARKKDAGSRG
jgi:bifunctional DNA-binding transcriptional regulator/antitoxin component of YhaV-PrlF toxin-antitoxin module